jgi:hypothetical protein
MSGVVGMSWMLSVRVHGVEEKPALASVSGPRE